MSVRSGHTSGVASGQRPTRKKYMPNSYDLQGRFAIVTGGAKGIGRAIAEQLIASGATVRIWDANPAQLPGASSDVVDITDTGAIEAALARMPRDDHPDILVNDAGYLGRTQDFVVHPSEDWQRIVAVNLIGMMRVTQAVLPRMLRTGRGRIVNLGSLAGKEGLANTGGLLGGQRGRHCFHQGTQS